MAICAGAEEAALDTTTLRRQIMWRSAHCAAAGRPGGAPLPRAALWRSLRIPGAAALAAGAFMVRWRACGLSGGGGRCHPTAILPQPELATLAQPSHPVAPGRRLPQMPGIAFASEASHKVKPEGQPQGAHLHSQPRRPPAPTAGGRRHPWAQAPVQGLAALALAVQAMLSRVDHTLLQEPGAATKGWTPHASACWNRARRRQRRLR